LRMIDDNDWKKKLERVQERVAKGNKLWIREQQTYRNWVADTFISSFFPDDEWQLYKRFKLYEAFKKEGKKDFSTIFFQQRLSRISSGKKSKQKF